MTEVTGRVGEQRLRRFRPYPDYKESGVQWLGEIPATWDIAPVYARYEVALGKMLDAKRVTGESPGKYLRNVDVQWDTVNIEGLPEMNFPPSDRHRYLLRSGDLLVCEGGEVGRTATWGGELDECFYQKAIHRVRPWSTSDVPRFFYFLMYAMAKRGVFSAGGNPNTIDHLTAVQLRRYRVPIPAASEQRAIVAFLDREAAKIDALVARKQRLIELLQEKRTALITHAVTRGLEPNIPMRESGAESLGAIPAHWEVKRLRHIVRHIEQGWSPACENREAGPGEWGVLKAGCVNRGAFFASEHKALPSTLSPIPALEIREGDVLMSRASGSRDLVGSVALVPECRPHLLLCDKVFRLHTDTRAGHRSFVVYAMNSRTVRWQIESALSGGSGLANNISQEAVKNLTIVQPPRSERRRIAEFLDQATASVDALIGKVREAMDRLQELRTALIAAAVTGKIHVHAASGDSKEACNHGRHSHRP